MEGKGTKIMGKLQLIPFIAAACILLLLVTGSMAAPSKGVIYVDSTPNGADIYLTNKSVSPLIIDFGSCP